MESFGEVVLRGWEALRPWIIVIEAKVPILSEVRWGAEDLLTLAGYQFCYFDDLNRLYVPSEHSELASVFLTPPNVFDGVRLAGLANSGLCRGVLEQHQREREKWEGQIAEHNARLQKAKAEADARIA